MHSNFNTPLVSIIVITYNSANYILETLESIRCQSYDNIELIITDDGSTDNSLEVCRKWIDEHQDRLYNIKLVESKINTGIAPNCNRGLYSASGEWIKLIAGDDALESNIIEEYIRFICGNSEIAAVFSKIDVYKEHFSPENKVSVTSSANEKFNSQKCSAGEQFEILLRCNCVDAPTVMVKRDVVKSLGGFDEEFPFLEDWPMWLKLTRAGYKMHFLDTVSVKYRIHSASIQELKNKRKYLSRVELEIDKMFSKRYNIYLPFVERLAKVMVIYRNSVIKKLFNNRNNFFVSILSTITGFVPHIILKYYKKRVA